MREKWWRWRHGVAYPATVVVVAAAALARQGLVSWVGEFPPYVTFLPCIMVVALFGGLGPGLLATGAAVLVAWVWVLPPVGQFALASTADAVGLGFFAGTGAFMSALADAYRRGRQEAVVREAEARAAVETERQRQLLAVTLASIGDGVIVTDRDGRVTFLNGEAERLTGWGNDEAAGRPLAEVFRIIDEATREGVESPVDKVLRLAAVVGLANHTLLVARDGRETPIDDSGAPIRGADGAIQGVVLVFRDFTERARAEEALRSRERQFRELADAMPQMVWAARADGVADYYNSRWRESTFDGDGTGDAIWVPLAHPDDRQRCVDLWHASVRSGQPYQVEYRMKLPAAGEYRWYLGRALPVRDDGGQVVRWYGTCTDVHDFRTALEALEAAKVSAERAKSSAEEATLAKDHFLAVLSHELRTPLTPVLTTASLLARDAELPDRYRDDVETIWRNVNLEARLIDDLLDVTRIIRGKVELDKRPVDLGGVIRLAVEVCMPDVEARQLHLGVDPGPDGPYVVHADATRLQQAFWNLLKNAVKFTPHGGCVGVRCRREAGDVVVEVTDSGQGMTADLMPRVFTAFEQGERSITRQFGGLGLGLTITKGLVDMHGGTVEAHSDGVGKGSMFRVRLPLADAALPANAGGRPGGAGGAPVPAKRALRILLVEDHGDTARIMKRLLQMDGHEVRAAGDVATGLEMALGEAFDLLISDLGLPDGSGVDLMRRLRASGSKLPGIAVSGYGQEEDIRRSREAGFAIHLTKPTSPDRLAESIAAVTNGGG